MILIRSDACHLPIADESVQCCVTSPPYWGLRSYHGGAAMIGLEPTFDEHLANLVAVFREVRRVLRKDGTCWLNYGDAYNAGTSARRKASADNDVGGWQSAGNMGDRRVKDGSTKTKDLMMMPARVAMALQADGWWLRSEIVWHKPNPMPESVTDRPTNSHEKVYLLTKSAKYFYDAEAVRQAPVKWPPNRPGKPKAAANPDRNNTGSDAEWQRMLDRGPGANLRNVWTIPTQGVSAAHFATFPEKLVEPCILAGTSAEGACAKCGAPWVRVGEKKLIGGHSRSSPIHDAETNDQGNNRARDGHLSGGRNEFTTLGWQPSCFCEAPTVPCTVLDPFVGSGTVCRVATRFNRLGIGCDLGYQKIAVERTTNVQRVLI